MSISAQMPGQIWQHATQINRIEGSTLTYYCRCEQDDHDAFPASAHFEQLVSVVAQDVPQVPRRIREQDKIQPGCFCSSSPKQWSGSVPNLLIRFLAQGIRIEAFPSRPWDMMHFERKPPT